MPCAGQYRSEQVQKLVGRNDAYVSLAGPLKSTFGRLARAVDEVTEKVTTVLALEPCEVSDADRLCFHDGMWYRAARP